VRSRTFARRKVNTSTYPTHSPLAEPRGSLGAGAVGRRRRSVGAVAVGRSVTIPSPPTLNPLGGAAFGRGGRSPVKTRARTLLTRRSQSLAARSVRSRMVSGGGGRSPEGHRSMGCRSAVTMPSPPIQKPSRRGGIRSRWSVAVENPCKCPNHSPLAEPRGLHITLRAQGNMRARYYLECRAGDKVIVIVVIIDHRHFDHDMNHRHSSHH